MRKMLLLMWVVAVGLACGSSGASSSSNKLAPFLGSWSCTYAGTYVFTGSTTVNTNPAYSSTATLVAGTTTDLEVTGLVTGAIVGTCDGTLDVTSTDVATSSPTDQSCQFTDASGDDQTNTGSGTFTVTGTTATDAVGGTFVGTTAVGAAYSGTYQGTWSCTHN